MVAPSAAICASERSTKITPRSTTCTPRYAWMPVRIRLATNGAARNGMTTESSTLLRSRRLDRVDQHRDVGLEQLEIVGRRRHAANRGRQHQHLGPGLRGDRVGRLRIEVGLDDDHLDLL